MHHPKCRSLRCEYLFSMAACGFPQSHGMHEGHPDHNFEGGPCNCAQLSSQVGSVTDSAQRSEPLVSERSAQEIPSDSSPLTVEEARTGAIKAGYALLQGSEPIALEMAFVTAIDQLILCVRQEHPKACPCHHTTPCDPRCACVMPLSSQGCQRCCAYGSPEQQAAAAEHLIHAERVRQEQAPKEICICAAIQTEDGVFNGHRHDGAIEYAARTLRWYLRNVAVSDTRKDELVHKKIASGVQGFTTSTGRFVDRYEGMRLQRAAGKRSHQYQDELRGDMLFSEDLY